MHPAYPFYAVPPVIPLQRPRWAFAVRLSTWVAFQLGITTAARAFIRAEKRRALQEHQSWRLLCLGFTGLLVPVGLSAPAFPVPPGSNPRGLYIMAGTSGHRKGLFPIVNQRGGGRNPANPDPWPPNRANPGLPAPGSGPRICRAGNAPAHARARRSPGGALVGSRYPLYGSLICAGLSSSPRDRIESRVVSGPDESIAVRPAL